MPRDGSNIYSQPFPDVVEDTTIESTVYNGFTNDIAADLNAPRPIVAGGTGAANADQALVNLSGEKAAMVVTNFDSHVWQPGSFYCATSATGSPVAGHAFSGIVYGSDPVATPPANQNVVIEARDVTDNKLYGRRKTAGVWSAWYAQDDLFVNTTGDTMTGDLTISKAAPGLLLNKPVSGTAAFVQGLTAGAARWTVLPGNGSAETGSNIGSDFNITRHNDTGTFIDTPLAITRASGSVTMTGQLTVTNTIVSATAATTGTYYFGNSSTKSLAYDGTNFNFSGGSLLAPTVVSSGGEFQAGTGAAGIYRFGSSGVKYLQFDGTSFLLVGGVLAVSSTLEATGYRCRAGSGGSYGVNYFNIFHSTAQQLWIDTTNVGSFAYTSDYRIKKDVIDLPGMWDTVKALRPIKYTQAEFTPPSAAEATQKSGEPFILADDIERWGFIAHELQETLVESAASGVKDSPDTIQSPNPFTVIAALTKALQEAMARIEALEAR